MSRLHHGTAIIVSLGLCCTAIGCATDGEEQRKERRAARLVEYRQELTVREGYPIPKDYQQRVDEWFARSLKDPDSRKVEFTSTRGPMACGQVNAKNSYGGYTGATPFGALFDQVGALKNVWLFDRPFYGKYLNNDLDDAVVALACGWPLSE